MGYGGMGPAVIPASPCTVPRPDPVSFDTNLVLTLLIHLAAAGLAYAARHAEVRDLAQLVVVDQNIAGSQIAMDDLSSTEIQNINLTLGSFSYENVRRDFGA